MQLAGHGPRGQHRAGARSACGSRHSLLATCLAVLLWAQPSPARLVNRILATIDGDPLTLYELRVFSEHQRRIRPNLPGDEMLLLKALITDRLLRKEATDRDLVVSNKDVDKYIENIKLRNHLTDEQLHTALQQQGISPEDYRKRVRQDLQRAQLINREIRGKVNVTPEDVRRWYDAHPEDYATEPTVTVSHIILLLRPDAPAARVAEVMHRADELHAQLEDGANFAELARKESQDSAAQSGGRLGTFKTGEMLPEMDAVVQDLPPGQFSAPFRTRVGVHIVRLDSRTTGGKVPLETVANKIKENLYGRALEERYARWLKEDLPAKHHVEELP